MITAVSRLYLSHFIISLFYCDSSADEPVVSADCVCQDVFIVAVATLRTQILCCSPDLEISGNTIHKKTDDSSFGIRVCRCYGYSLISCHCLSVHVLGSNHGNKREETKWEAMQIEVCGNHTLFAQGIRIQTTTKMYGLIVSSVHF